MNRRLTSTRAGRSRFRIRDFKSCRSAFSYLSFRERRRGTCFSVEFLNMTEQELKTQINAIERGPELITVAAAGVDEKTLHYKPSPDKWCIVEILGHLADIEVLYGHRMRQMIADREPVIAPIDQDDWARNLGYMDASAEELLDAYRTARRANLRLLRRLTPADLEKGAFHPERKRKVTLAELIGMMVGHDPNHASQIERLKQQARAASA